MLNLNIRYQNLVCRRIYFAKYVDIVFDSLFRSRLQETNIVNPVQIELFIDWTRTTNGNGNINILYDVLFNIV